MKRAGAPNGSFPIGKLSVRKDFDPSDFLKIIVTSNFRDRRNLMSIVFGLLKMSLWVPKKAPLSIIGKAIRPTPKVVRKWAKKP